MVVPVRGATLASSSFRANFFAAYALSRSVQRTAMRFRRLNVVLSFPIISHLIGFASVHGNAVIYLLPCGSAFGAQKLAVRLWLLVRNAMAASKQHSKIRGVLLACLGRRYTQTWAVPCAKTLGW